MEPGLKLGIVYIGKAGGKVRTNEKNAQKLNAKITLDGIHLASKLVKFHTIPVT